MVKAYISHINETNIQHVFLIVQEVYTRELFIKIFFCKKRKAKAMKWIRDVEISSNAKPKLNIKQFKPFCNGMRLFLYTEQNLRAARLKPPNIFTLVRE